MVISSWRPSFCQNTKFNFQRLSVRIVRPVHTHFSTFTLEGGNFVWKVVRWGFKIFQISINIQKRPCDKDKEHISVSEKFFTVKKKFCTAWLTKVVLNMESMKNDYFNVNSQWKTVQDVATIPLAKAKAAPTSSLPETQI